MKKGKRTAPYIFIYKIYNLCFVRSVMYLCKCKCFYFDEMNKLEEKKYVYKWKMNRYDLSIVNDSNISRRLKK